MPMSDADKLAAMRELVKEMFVRPHAVATMNTDDLKDAFDKLDSFLDDKTTSQLNGEGALTGTNTMVQNMVAYLPEPFRTTSTVEQKALLLAYWAMKRGGLA